MFQTWFSRSRISENLSPGKEKKSERSIGPFLPCFLCLFGAAIAANLAWQLFRLISFFTVYMYSRVGTIHVFKNFAKNKIDTHKKKI